MYTSYRHALGRWYDDQAAWVFEGDEMIFIVFVGWSVDASITSSAVDRPVVGERAVHSVRRCCEYSL